MARIAVIGLGKVGLPFASHMVSLGHDVAGFDTSEAITSLLEQGWNPFPWEDIGADKDGGFKMRLSKTRMEGALDGAEAAFVIVPTPQDGDYLSPNTVKDVVERIQADPPESLRAIVVVSTLDPRLKRRDGDYDAWLRGKVPVVYCPPLIRLGTVKADLAGARILFLGGTDQEAMDFVESIYYPNGRPTNVEKIQGDYVTIAAAKMAINATLSARTAWANDVAGRARRVGADPDVVLRAVRSDPRIGASCMYAGPPPGGPCLPRDMAVWASMAGTYGLTAATLDAHKTAAQEVLDGAKRWIFKYGTSPKVGILGLTYNPKGLDVTNSTGVALWNDLKRRGVKVRVTDPAHAAIPHLPGGFKGVEDKAAPIVEWADVIVVATLWDEYRELATDKPKLVLDWRGA